MRGFAELVQRFFGQLLRIDGPDAADRVGGIFLDLATADRQT
jgi:hypothetical protein